MTRDREVELDILRRLTPRQKLDIMHGLLARAVELKAAWLRSTRPELTEADVIALAKTTVAGDRS